MNLRDIAVVGKDLSITQLCLVPNNTLLMYISGSENQCIEKCGNGQSCNNNTIDTTENCTVPLWSELNLFAKLPYANYSGTCNNGKANYWNYTQSNYISFFCFLFGVHDF